jgi:alkylation response protein AidB-like acyl-CoA dehydrogenase
MWEHLRRIVRHQAIVSRIAPQHDTRSRARLLTGNSTSATKSLDCTIVDFDLSEDQVALKDAAHDLVGHEKWWERLRERVGVGSIVGTLPATASESEAPSVTPSDAPSGFDDELWAAMADQGWLLVERPEDEGGFGGSMVEVAILSEVVGGSLAAVPFSSSAVCAQVLSSSDVDVSGLWQEELGSGRATACLVWGFNEKHYDLDAKASRLTGRFGPVVYGPSSTYALVALQEGLFGIALDTVARPKPLPAMDRTRELGYLELDNAPVIALGNSAASRRAADRMTVAVSAEMLGAANKVLDFSVAYAKDRVQFGKPIGSFQAIKHRLADVLVDVEGMRSTVYYAAWALSATEREASLATSMAKSWCTEASARVMASGLQVHGGIGFTWEHDMHLYLKRAQLDQVSCGNASWHKDRVGMIVKDRILAGESIT